MGCDGVVRQVTHHFGISIHAPTWGATEDAKFTYFLTSISIHAPTWGATSGASMEAPRVSEFQSTHPRGVRRCPLTLSRHRHPHFNPRTHVGCDSSVWMTSTRFGYFNPRTHVGCDPCRCPCPRQADHFNPRTHVGCDKIILVLGIVLVKFQSTHPRGVRLCTI